MAAKRSNRRLLSAVAFHATISMLRSRLHREGRARLPFRVGFRCAGGCGLHRSFTSGCKSGYRRPDKRLEGSFCAVQTRWRVVVGGRKWLTGADCLTPPLPFRHSPRPRSRTSSGFLVDDSCPEIRGCTISEGASEAVLYRNKGQGALTKCQILKVCEGTGEGGPWRQYWG